MRRMLFAAGLTLAVAASSVAEARSACESYAHQRRVNGTIGGAVVGGLLGNVVSGHGHKGTGTLVGAGLGAVVGNNISRTSCDRRYGYYRHSRYRHSARAYAPARASYPQYAASGACHYVNRPYYDQTGQLAYAPVQVCD